MLAAVISLIALSAPIPDPLPTTLPHYQGATPTRSPSASPISGRRSTRAPAFKVYAGSGLGFNNNDAGIAIGPDGTAYLAVTGGVMALR